MMAGWNLRETVTLLELKRQPGYAEWPHGLTLQWCHTDESHCSNADDSRGMMATDRSPDDKYGLAVMRALRDACISMAHEAIQ